MMPAGHAVTRAGSAALLAPALIAASAIGHATAGPTAPGPTIVTVGDRPAAIATGFTVGSDRVVTVAHVLGSAAVTVRGADGVARRATVLRREAALDLALLHVPGLRPAPAAVRAGTRVLVRRDDRMSALPARVVRRVTARVRSAGTPGAERRPALELAFASAPGDSGAPVVEHGRVTGVVFARSRGRPGVAYAVDGSVLERLLR
jgi:hypothetical protein